MSRWVDKLARRVLRQMGYQGEAARIVLGIIKKDLANRSIDLRTRLWAWRKGFASTRIQVYGINRDNYLYHVPDFDYYRLHPFNGRYGHWIDDKLTLRYLLAPYKAWLPAYYYQIRQGQVIRLPDCPPGLPDSCRGILDLLQQQGRLAVKPLAGSLGEGFYLLQAQSDGLYRNLEPISREALLRFLEGLDGYLVTKYVVAHPAVAALNPATPNTIRVQMLRSGSEPAHLAGCFIRIGTRRSGVRETPLAGAIIARIDKSSGRVGDAYHLVQDKLVALTVHPDSGLDLQIQIPHWEQILSGLYEIMDYLPQLVFVGFDLIATETGFAIIEINSLTATTALPFFDPLLADPVGRNFFKTLFLTRPGRFKRVLRQIRALEQRTGAP